jgi:hypothetical protein
MRKKFLIPHSSFLIAAALLLTVSCGKEQTCRCSVLGTQNVRIVKIDKGTCDQIKTFTYHNAMDSVRVDSLLCTGYEFRVDSIYQ